MFPRCSLGFLLEFPPPPRSRREEEQTVVGGREEGETCLINVLQTFSSRLEAQRLSSSSSFYFYQLNPPASAHFPLSAPPLCAG